MAGLTAVVTAIADIQFNAIVEESFATQDARTAFFGEFFALLNMAAFFLQLLVTARLLKKFGLGVALMVLPLFLALGSAAVFVLPGLATAILLKASDGGFRHSINKAAVEVLFLPIPDAAKQKAKVFLDATVDNAGTGVGALLVLGLTTGLGVPFRYASLISLAAIVVWLFLAARARPAYVDSFRKALDKREIDPEQIRVHISDASSLENILETLSSENERQLDYALGLLGSVQDPRIVDAVDRLVDHDSAEVRHKAIRVLSAQETDTLGGRAAELLGDVDPRVRVEAVNYLCVHGDRPEEEMLERFLGESDIRLQAAALECIAEYFPTSGSQLLSTELVSSVLARAGDEDAELARRALARALGTTDDPKLQEYLVNLTNDASPEVVRESILSAGRVRQEELLQPLVSLLADRRYRGTARKSLRDFGDAAVSELARALEDRQTPEPVQAQIPRVLGRMESQEAVEALLEHLKTAAPTQRFRALKALSKLRTASSDLTLARPLVDPIIDKEIAYAVELADLFEWAASRPASSEFALLSKALSEKRKESLERLFRLLGLIYPPRDIYNAFLGVTSDNQRVQASALEFLDNLLEADNTHPILPLVERHVGAAAPRAGAAWPDDSIQLGKLIGNPDPWIRACAIFASKALWDEAIAPAVEAARNDTNAIVRETATTVIDQQGQLA